MNQSPYIRAYEAGIKLARLEHFSKHANEGDTVVDTYSTDSNPYMSFEDNFSSYDDRHGGGGLGSYLTSSEREGLMNSPMMNSSCHYDKSPGL